MEVLFTYDAQEPDELSLVVGESVKNVTEQETGWYKGFNREGGTGVFPSNFVKV